MNLLLDNLSMRFKFIICNSLNYLKYFYLLRNISKDTIGNYITSINYLYC